MPHVTTAKSLAFSFDPRASSQLAWLTHAVSVATGTTARKSAVLRLALALLAERVSWHAQESNLDAMRAAVERLPEFATCGPAGIDRAVDKAGKLLPWKAGKR